MNQHNDIPGLEVLGPDWVEAWTDSSCVGKLCSRCETTLAKIDQPIEWKWEDDGTDVQRRQFYSLPVFYVLWPEDEGPQLRDVRNSAHNGCHFCTLILSGMLHERKRIRLTREVGTAHLSRVPLRENDRIYLVLTGEQDRGFMQDRDKPPDDLKLTVGINRWLAAGQTGFDLLPAEDLDRTDQRRGLFSYVSSGSPGAPGEHRCCHLTSEVFDIRQNFDTIRTVGDDQEEDQYETTTRYIEFENEGSERFVTTERTIERQVKYVYYRDPVSPVSHSDEETEDKTPDLVQKYDSICTILTTEHAPFVGVAGRYLTDRLLTIEGDEQGSPEVAEVIAKHWLANCLEYHDCSPDRGTDPVLPHRVLDVVGRNGQPFLVQTNGQQMAKYVTLSYQWGNSRQLMTTTDTVEEMYRSIPIQRMPKTFKDVVMFTRLLDIQYLWIDALCIIQDSKEDCLQQLSVMSEIYAQSTLTIAAIGSCNADDGCGPCRNKLALCRCQFSQRSCIQPSERYKDFSLIESQSLHGRAWCLQETEITPRLLSLGADQLYWQCRETVCRESNPMELYTPQSVARSVKIGGWPLLKRSFDHDATNPFSKSYFSWYKLVERYSQRQITFRADKLPAISALANQFAISFAGETGPANSEDYCCGLWRQDLYCGLIWTAESPSKFSVCHYVAPSWSWAASNDDISFHENDTDENRRSTTRAEILDVNIELASSLTPFGAVKSGKMTLRASVSGLPSPCYEPNSASYRRRQDDLESMRLTFRSLETSSDRADAPNSSDLPSTVSRSERSDRVNAPNYSDIPSMMSRSEHSDQRDRLDGEPASDNRSRSEQAQLGDRGISTSRSLSPWDNDRDIPSSRPEPSETDDEMRPFDGLSDSSPNYLPPNADHESEVDLEYISRGNGGGDFLDDEKPRRRYIVREDDVNSNSDGYYANRRVRYRSHSRSRSSTAPSGTVVLECWQRAYWDHNWDEIPTTDCKVVRLTDDWAMIVTPVRRYGTVGTAKGCTGGLYMRVGMLMIRVVYEGDEENWTGAYGQKFQQLFEFDWTDEQVVTIM